jgi:microcystin-dependent protein
LNFAPKDWAFCDGSYRLWNMRVYFELIGTTHGGDGETTLRCSDLRGRAPIHAGQGLGK